MKMKNHTEQQDAEHTWYSPNTTHWIWLNRLVTQSAEAVEYTDFTSAEG